MNFVSTSLLPSSPARSSLPLAPTGFQDLGLATRWAQLLITFNYYLPSTLKDQSTTRAELTVQLQIEYLLMMPKWCTQLNTSCKGFLKADIFVVSIDWIFIRLKSFNWMKFFEWNFGTNFHLSEKHVFSLSAWNHPVDFHMCGHTYESDFHPVEKF